MLSGAIMVGRRGHFAARVAARPFFHVCGSNFKLLGAQVPCVYKKKKKKFGFLTSSLEKLPLVCARGNEPAPPPFCSAGDSERQFVKVVYCRTSAQKQTHGV